jgi:hypothetical protein
MIFSEGERCPVFPDNEPLHRPLGSITDKNPKNLPAR